MENVIDINERLEDRKWNETVEDLLLSCTTENPEDILILIETYLVGKRKANGDF